MGFSSPGGNEPGGYFQEATKIDWNPIPKCRFNGGELPIALCLYVREVHEHVPPAAILDRDEAISPSAR
jgi:hypothetical protein